MRDENPALTALRGLAAMWVIAHHLVLFLFSPSPPAALMPAFRGYAGVDVFFALSGFVLALAYGELRGAGTGQFFIRRALRIYPMHIAVMLVLAGYVLACRPSWMTPDWRYFLAALPLLHAYLLPGQSQWNGVTWSLCVEIVCYLGFPLLVGLLRRLPDLLLLLAVLALCLGDWRIQQDLQGAWTGWPALLRGAGGFGLGTALGMARLRMAPWRGAVRALAWGGEIIAALLFMLAVGRGWMSLLSIAAAMLIFCLGLGGGLVFRLLDNRALVHVGRISYSIYLIHLPLMIVFLALFRFGGAPPLSAYLVFGLALYVGVVIAIATITYRCIELPARRIGRGAGAPRLVLGAAAPAVR